MGAAHDHGVRRAADPCAGGTSHPERKKPSHEAEAALKVLKTFAPTCEAAYEDSRKQRATLSYEVTRPF